MIPPEDYNEKAQRNMVSFIVGLSSAPLNNTVLYLYGGKGGGQIYNDNIWHISAKDISLNGPPTLLSSKAHQKNEKANINLNFSPGGVIIDNSIITICSNNSSSNNNSSNLNTATANSSSLDFFTTCSFDLSNNSKNNTWFLTASLSSLTPLVRKEYSVSVTSDKRQFYLFGGKQINVSEAIDTSISTQLQSNGIFWMYDIESYLWSKLISPFVNNLSRCGHTSSILSDGRIVIIGGYTCSTTMPSKTEISRSVDLMPMNQLLLFDTKMSSWINVPKIQGVTPAARTYHSAIIMNNKDDIFICGGQNEVASPFQIYLGSESNHLEDMSAILDTISWTWRIPTPSHLNQPYPQSFATLSLINDTKLVFGFGVNYHTVYDQFRIFDTLTETWQQISPSINNDIGHSIRGNITANFNTTILWVILGCIGIIGMFSYGVAIWRVGFRRFHSKVMHGLTAIKKEAWKPRVGEPGWAETLRLILKLLFLFLFVYLIFTLTSQVINSPIIDQLSFETSPEMNIDVPDIKFCFENNDEVEGIKKVPFIQCATDFGAQCSQFVTPLQDHTGIEETTTRKHCFLFNAPVSFKLGQTSERLHSNGSFLKFEYYYKTNGITPIMNNEVSNNIGSNQVRVQVYNKLNHLKSSNNSPYHYDSSENNNNDDNISFSYIGLNDLIDKGRYKFASSKGRTVKNTYQLNFGVTSTINFELIKRVTLESGVWNYVGVASSVSTKYEIETVETPEYFSTVYDPSSGAPQPLGSLNVVPLTTQTKVLREQKAFAFINAMGIFGGLFGLLFSLQSCLFGYRPRSPWGYMHRWSFGHLRSSLMRGLQVNFFPNNNIIVGNSGSNIQSASSSSNFHKQQQESLSKYTMSHMDRHADSSIAMKIDQVMNNSSSIHPLSVQTKNLHNTTSYLLPTSPTLSIPMGHHEGEKEIRMALIEDRIHMLERLFQAYYIDDEIFRSLDHALKSDSLSSASSSCAGSSQGGGRKSK